MMMNVRNLKESGMEDHSFFSRELFCALKGI